MPSWRLHIGIFWKSHFMTFSRYLLCGRNIKVLDYFFEKVWEKPILKSHPSMV
jgi:hypothetical protein